MDRRVPRTSFEPQGEIQELSNTRVFFVKRFKLGNCFKRLRDADVPAAYRWRDQFRNPLDVAVGHVQCPAHVLYRGPRGHRSEGDDLANGFAAVKLSHVIYHVGAAADAEIDIDIGHRNAFGIEEALEKKIVLQWDRYP